jgi:peptide/nickel transport system permease protein
MTSRTFRHWLGTDDAGRDIAAGIVGGARVALLTGLFAMAIALIIGVFLGALAGFFGDDRFLLYRSRAWILPAGALIAFLYVFVARFYVIQTSSQEAIWKNTIAPFAGILLASAGIARLLRLFPYWSARIVIPLDLIVMRVTEVFNAIPKLILILSVAAMSPGNHSIWFIIGMIGIMSWTDMAQLVRSELLRIRELEYVTAARGLGFTETRILLRHALPNAIQPVLIACAFGVSGAILIEASLSFLGIGDDGLKGISWGSLLFSARSTNLRYWWIAIPPGLMIFATIMALTNLGDVLGARKES